MFIAPVIPVEGIERSLQIIIEQTKAKKVHVVERGSSIHSDTREKFFVCPEVPFNSEFERFRRFANPTRQKIMLAEVKKYSKQMLERYNAGQTEGKNYVQKIIRDSFLPTTLSCMNNAVVIMNEKKYSLKKDTEALDVQITGITDHTLQVPNCEIASLTIEDKAIGMIADRAKSVAQALSQIEYEVEQLEKALNFVPEEFIGLLQNGITWTAIIRRFHGGKVFTTNIQSPPAFDVNNPTTISVQNCEKIARLIEHSYCVADQISHYILHPASRPVNFLHPIVQHYDEEESNDEDEGEGDVANRKQFNTSRLGPMNRNSTTEASCTSNSAPTDGNIRKKSVATYCSEKEYYLLPLTLNSLTKINSIK